MNIPKTYSEILENNKFLKGIVYSTLETFAQIYSENKLFFFEEYTDHGIRHIESVLRSSIDIIPEDAMKDFFNEENVAALLLSVLLHDLGMHQSPKTFKHLIKQKKILFPELDLMSWHDLWENYTEEAKKFNSQKKKEIFGEYDYVITIPELEDIDSLNGYQKKLIGEFIRRHHARMAHEIAVHGFETGDSVIKFAENYDSDKLDIVGMIARSHGMNIRDTYSYLQEKYSRINKNPYGIHIYNLMIILRLSDYFQIDIERLSLVSLKLKSFKSPVSETEHNKHFAIKEIRQIDEDPETLFIRALPKTNFIYWKLIDLIKEIQNELDICWAVIGEKYGKDKKKPLLKYRRIISNLDESNFKATIPFIPEKIHFDADPDLAKLLVAPLYGNNPTYGVRELLQNAIDAIQERIFLEKLDTEFDSHIEINILHDTNEEYYFEIRDNGKGMNVKEIKNYFLKAGATNRKSKEWDDLYLDTHRESKVLKSGKFGVGILAAFLIGDEIEVRTRRFESNNGLFFTANINSKDVDVTKISDCPIGTSIKIKINEEAFKFFKSPANQLISWDKWYTLRKPRIKFNNLLESTERLGYEKYNPSFFDVDQSWVEFSSKGYSKLRWSYGQRITPYSDTYELTCNGLIIPSPPKIYSGSIPSPNIQVFDFNGLFPINLNRNTLDSNYLPFEADLIKSVFREILSVILSIEPLVVFNNDKIILNEKRSLPQLFGGIRIHEYFRDFLYSTNGYALKNGYLNDFVRSSKIISINIAKVDGINSLPIKFNDVFLIEFWEDSLNVKGNIDLGTGYSNVEWAIYPDSSTDYNWLEVNSKYKKDILIVSTKKFITFRRNDIKVIPVYLGFMSIDQIGVIRSIICYSWKSFPINNMNSSFNNFLAEIFADLQDSFIPYNVKDKDDKVKEILCNALK